MRSTDTQSYTFSQRAELASNPVAKKLFLLMESKQSNLAVAADFTKKKELLDLAENVGSEICVLKTHIDILEDFDRDTTERLVEIANRKQFLIFEDRKFADIGSTVKLQFSSGIYQISSWADIINAHTLPGAGIIEGLISCSDKKQHALLLLAQMSSKESLFTEEYTLKTVELALKYPEFVAGFISQNRITNDPRFLHLTPGVSLSSKGDKLGQQYNTPRSVIKERGSDIIIVGRGIYQSDDPREAAKRYREAGWCF